MKQQTGGGLRKTSSDFQGMRWFKCDLHMDTPADARHWHGVPIGSGPYRSAAGKVPFFKEEFSPCMKTSKRFSVKPPQEWIPFLS
jgi:hypothetical protein